MQRRKLGYTDVELTTIGLGTWAIGGGEWEFGWGDQDDQASIATIREALEAGINWIDTAAAYGFGHAEEVVGKAIKGLGKRPLVATKCSLLNDGHGKVVRSLKRDSILKEAEDSLRRLQVDVIDIYQIHWPNPEEDIEEAWEAMAELVRQQKVRYIGVSNFNVAQMQRIQSIHPIASLQPPYSMLRRQIEAEILPFCAAHNIGVIVYSPMQKGLLTGKITPDWVKQLGDNDHRKRDPMFNSPQLEINLEFIAKLKPMADKYHISLATLAVNGVLQQSAVTAAIVGARKPGQILDAVRAADVEIAQQDWDQMNQWLNERDAAVAKVV